MPIRYEKRITREMLRAEPDTLFVFGDNLRRKGLGGQAREMRGEPNAVGLPTKREPSMHEAAYFTDADVDEFWNAALPNFNWLAHHLARGGSVVLPEDGIGTGLADLKRRAPEIWSRLQWLLAKLRSTPSPAAPFEGA